MASKPHQLKSLRSGYLVVATILGLGLIIGVISSHRYTSSLTEESVTQLDAISAAHDVIKIISNSVAKSISSLEQFLLEPNINEHRQRIDESLILAQAETINLTRMLKDINWEESLILRRLDETLLLLQSNIEVISFVRTTPGSQYPAMQYASEDMEPENRAVLGAFRIALREYESLVLDRSSTPEIHQNFQLIFESMLQWTLTVSDFRIYMANRIGGLSEEFLRSQESQIEEVYQSYIEKINYLSKSDSQMGFETDSAIDDIQYASGHWFAAYLQVRDIHRSDHWRIDTLVMQETIIPAFNEVQRHLTDLDNYLEHERNKINLHQNQIRWLQQILVIIIILMFILYIIINIYTIERTILRPIAQVSRALKEIAFNQDRPFEFSTITSRETEDLVEAFKKMSQKVHSRQTALEYQAHHDALTHLPNRVMLRERLEYHLMLSKRNKCEMVLFILDLNRFKEVNDTLGHHIGDLLLIEVGERINAMLREVDTIARLGGDEFAILLPNTQRNQSGQVADKIAEIIASPFQIEGQTLHISASIGIAVCPRDGDSANSLMQHADVAMYEAKRNKIAFSFYDSNRDSHSVGKLSLVSDLKDAIRNSELNLYYQPKLSLSDHSVIGVETLLRWQHPTNGFISPEEIIELAEETGQIDTLTEFIFRQAIIDSNLWKDEGYDLNTSINISVANLHSGHLVVSLGRVLSENQLDASNITLELTESGMMANPEGTLLVLNALKSMRVNLSIDDFGTGFSSLSYLKKLPVKEIKIDKSFVMDLLSDESDAVIVRSTIELGHNLGLQVVAEGVESKEIWDLLQLMGCDTAQGYYMSRPIPFKQFSIWLKENYSKALVEKTD